MHISKLISYIYQLIKITIFHRLHAHQQPDNASKLRFHDFINKSVCFPVVTSKKKKNWRSISLEGMPEVWPCDAASRSLREPWLHT